MKLFTVGTHGGGNRAIIAAIKSGDKSILLTPIKDSLEGRLMVFAAEESRASGTIAGLKEYEDKIRGLDKTSSSENEHA